MKQLYPNAFQDSANSDQDEKIMKTNFLKAAIFYEDLSQEIVSEVPVYTVSIPNDVVQQIL